MLVASLAVLGSALTACGTGPSQVNSAVIIGDRVISVDDIQQRLDKALKAEPAAKDLAKTHKLDVVSRGIVSQLIRHELVTAAAKREGLTLSESDLADLTAASAPSQDPVQRSVQAAFDPKEIAKDQLLTVSLGLKSLDKVQLTLDGVAIQLPGFTKQKATDLAKQLAAQPDKAAALGKAAGGDQQQQGVQPLAAFPYNAIRVYEGAAQSAAQSGQAPPADALIAPIFAAPSNSVIVLSLGSSDSASGAGYLIALVRRAGGGVPATDASFASEVPKSWQYALGQSLLGPYAKDLGVRISPRYGVWDDLAVAIAPSEAEKLGVLLPAAAQGS